MLDRGRMEGDLGWLSLVRGGGGRPIGTCLPPMHPEVQCDRQQGELSRTLSSRQE